MWNLRNVRMVVILGLLTIVTVLNMSLAGCNEKESLVDPMNYTSVPEATIPAIDADAPMRTETATFALG